MGAPMLVSRIKQGSGHHSRNATQICNDTTPSQHNRLVEGLNKGLYQRHISLFYALQRFQSPDASRERDLSVSLPPTAWVQLK